jgi:hypothetical protein
MLIYILETDTICDRTIYTNSQEALIASYHYPDFEVKEYNVTNDILNATGYYFKGGVKKQR